jgi:hypothetical protein
VQKTKQNKPQNKTNEKRQKQKNTVKEDSEKIA